MFKKSDILGWLLVGWTVVPGLIACSTCIKQNRAVKDVQKNINGILDVLHQEGFIQIKKD